MIEKVNKFTLALFVTLFSNAALCGTWTISAVSVPVDSPIALIGLAAAIGLIAARIVKNR